MASEQPSKDGSPGRLFSLILLRIFAGFLGLVGGAIVVGGIMLIGNGGSPYYLVAGALMIVSALFLMARDRLGAWIYGLMLALTLIWSIFEVGFDLWALMPRLMMLSVIGLWIIMPWTQKPLRGQLRLAQSLPLGSTGLIVGSAVVSIALGAGIFYAFVRLPEDPLFQTGFGAFPEDTPVAYDGQVGEDWPYFGGDLGGGRFSPLEQITPQNVANLQVAWSADVGQRPYNNATPLKIGEMIYTCNGAHHMFGVNARTGETVWDFDASEQNYGGSCRGVAYHSEPTLTGQVCENRVISGTSTAKLVAVDAATGVPCADFGNNGFVDLSVGMADYEQQFIPGYYRVTSAPTIVRGRVVVGGWVSDGQYWGQTSGVIRAFDAVTGEFAWAWDLGNPDVHTEPPAGETYTVATPNSWAPMSGDEDLGLVFLPTGNATPDYFGAQRRSFDDEFSTSVVAVNAETGEMVWHFQTLHHDLWDYDVPAQPTLIDLPRDGGVQPALIQATKQGELFVLDRRTGKPIFDVTETAVPQDGGVPEERLSPTQPRSNQLPSFRGAMLREADMWGITPLDQLYCRVLFSGARYEGINTPPGLTPSIQFPSSFGAVNWGSVSIDPRRGVMVVNHNRFITYNELLTRAEADAMGLEPLPAYASGAEVGAAVAQSNTDYAAYPRFWLTALGIPCLAPPYGLFSAVDLNTGKLLWSERLGTSLGSGPAGLKFPIALPMGTPTHGGSLVTSSGLVFIGATPDNIFRAFDLRNGKELWHLELAGGPSSTPISYTLDGKQYVVVMATGQGAIGSRPGTKMMAFALPN